MSKTSSLSIFDDLISDIKTTSQFITLRVKDCEDHILNLDPVRDEVSIFGFETPEDLLGGLTFWAILGSFLLCSNKNLVVSHFVENDPGLSPYVLAQFALQVYTERIPELALELSGFRGHVGPEEPPERLDRLGNRRRERYVSSLILPCYLVRGCNWTLFCNVLYSLGFPPRVRVHHIDEPPPGRQPPGLVCVYADPRWSVKLRHHSTPDGEEIDSAYSESSSSREGTACFSGRRHLKLYSESKILEWIETIGLDGSDMPRLYDQAYNLPARG
jgi:hypothetical protein